jgi:hypothetical protein
MDRARVGINEFAKSVEKRSALGTLKVTKNYSMLIFITHINNSTCINYYLTSNLFWAPAFRRFSR